MRPGRHALAACLIVLAASLAPAWSAEPVPADAELFAHPQDLKQIDALLGALRAQLASAEGVRGSFVQRKHLAGLPQPLTSSGEFLVARGLGVHWHTKLPFESELLLTPAGLLQREAGRESLRLSAQQQPGLPAFTAMFYDLLALDVTHLAQRFELFGMRDGKGWRLGLKPRDAALAGQIAAIVIRGADQVKQVRLVESGGDRTEIDLAGAALPRLGPAERALLAMPAPQQGLTQRAK